MADLSKPLRAMKRILILLLALMPMIANAQKVTSNERDEKGLRTIETNIRAFFVDGHSHGCQLSYMEQDGKGLYNIFFAISDQANKWVAKSGQIMLMKDAEGNIYEIPAGGASFYTLAPNSKGAGIRYMVAVPYLLTPEQAEVFDKGLVKVRIAFTYEDTNTEGLMDINIPTDLTTHLKKAKKNIDKTIPMPVTVDKSVF